MNNRLAAVIVLAVLPAALAAARKETKDSKATRTVDSGSFGIYLRGQRIGTETFTVQQGPDSSVANSEVKVEDKGQRADQSSELRLSSTGDFVRYHWHELAPGKSESSVEFKDQFVVQHVAVSPGEKPHELAFMLPPSTMVLDDNFFIHREILLWRYIATACGPTPSPTGCKMERGQFGIFVPRQEASAMVNLEYRGKEKVNLKGAERELDRFELISDNIDWAIWMDAQYKVQRIVVESEGVEVVRD